MYFVIQSFSWVLSLLPLQSLSSLAHALAFILFKVLRLRRKLLLSNLDIAFGDTLSREQKHHVAYQSLYHFILTALEFLHERKGRLSDHVTFEGEENLRQALAKGQGVYILCMHMGSWEAMGGAITRHFAPAYVLVKKVGSPGINRFVVEQRRRNSFCFIERKKKGDGMLGIVRALKEKHMVGFVMDQARPGEPKLPFFGTPAKTNTSFAAIWRRQPAPIVMSYAIRTSVGQHVVKFLPEVQGLTVSDNLEADILKHSQYFNELLESCIRQHPEQYFWLHDRWKE